MKIVDDYTIIEHRIILSFELDSNGCIRYWNDYEKSIREYKDKGYRIKDEQLSKDFNNKEVLLGKSI